MKAINSIFISINSHIQNINDDKLIIIHIPYPNQCLHDIYQISVINGVSLPVKVYHIAYWKFNFHTIKSEIGLLL